MKKYIFTNSMKRYERCNLSKKVYLELLRATIFTDCVVKLEKDIKSKNRKQFYRSKKDTNIHAIGLITFKGLKIYLIMGQNKAFDIIFNSSPIDAGHVEYIRIAPTVVPTLYYQHVFDRYNERAYDRKFTTHKEIMKQLFINNLRKPPLSINEDGSIIQRLNEGFLLGNVDKKNDCMIFNTFYDNEEYKDTDEKGFARKAKLRMDELTKEQVKQYDLLCFKQQQGGLSQEEFNYELKRIGVI